MGYESYEDYMRSVLGYHNNMNWNCPNMCMNNQTPYQGMFQSTDDLERMYPDTYRIVHPMVVSACNMASMPVSEEMLDRMTDDIYDRASQDSRISIDINIDLESRDDSDSRQISEQSRQRRPRRRNRFFRDLIRILLLRELLGRRQRFPMRPF